ncbi:hypothetical protein BBO99_00004081 [Phytophthora kernoviae]|uniref:Cytidyltransferase-like domain-containing protein n=2 Tax=Phytophthora kernoviae TaxID=325452 RepID=A0A3R7IHU4_9STRA|nr:hypothetical protein G195_004708 [Phytophthora kernoviae 00238/432]KAG2526498.1 hypothetical protein JM16_002865 [Phytophthora kernoviae]KAG2527981.1 hypothetical protein JM18_003424 [Phytophthora kernoviae]RLN14609.1 hypothetical protein BBI17_004215 [Phytophthora kernoviae]RLN81014.1 hypothetical protein BBO99_00004081 [Phytophthora kernoviae]
MIERLLTAVYTREPHVKVVAAVTGGGVSVAESLFRPGSSSTMLHFAVPYSRASLQSFLSSTPSPSKLKFCSAETSERMALAAWKQAEEITRQEAEEDDAQAAAALPNALKRFKASLGIACTAGLATNYPKKGPHECFLSVDPLNEVCSGKVDQLISVGFFPVDGCDGSFNPLHMGHVELAQVAQQLMRSRTGIEMPLAFELAVANADKGAIESSMISARVAQFSRDNSLGLGVWPVLVTNATLFGQKAEILPGCTFIIGADTAIRIVDKKYYDMDEHKMVLALDRIARNGCCFVVAGRFDGKTEKRFVTAEEVLEQFVPSEFRHLFILLPETKFRNDMSSTEIRQRMATK